jgi:hypothetical protein
MPRPQRKGDGVRLNLELTPATKERLDRLQEATEARSMVEAITRALAVYETLVKEYDRGSEIVVRRKDGKELTLLLVPA